MDIGFAAKEIKDLCLRKCDTIFYATIALTALVNGTCDLLAGEFSGAVYGALLAAAKYREFLRLMLWFMENPRYGMACVFGAFAAAAASTLSRYPGYFLFEACVYLVLRTASALLFGLDEKQVVKLYLDVLLNYYDRSAPPRAPHSGARKPPARKLARAA